MKVLIIEKKQIKDGKEWIIIKCPKCGYERAISFEELGEIAYLVGQCEDKKYPNGQGAEMVKDFLENAVLVGMTYEQYCQWKKIPQNKI